MLAHVQEIEAFLFGSQFRAPPKRISSLKESDTNVTLGKKVGPALSLSASLFSTGERPHVVVVVLATACHPGQEIRVLSHSWVSLTAGIGLQEPHFCPGVALATSDSSGDACVQGG